jgi:hypothetical protein
VKHLLIAGHGYPGGIKLSENLEITGNLLQKEQQINQINREGGKITIPLDRLNFLHKLGQYLCAGATIEFFVCQAGAGQEGRNLGGN